MKTKKTVIDPNRQNETGLGENVRRETATLHYVVAVAGAGGSEPPTPPTGEGEYGLMLCSAAPPGGGDDGFPWDIFIDNRMPQTPMYDDNTSDYTGSFLVKSLFPEKSTQKMYLGVSNMPKEVNYTGGHSQFVLDDKVDKWIGKGNTYPDKNSQSNTSSGYRSGGTK